MKVTNSTVRLNELFDSDPRNDTAIAKSLGVSKQSVSSWRSGDRSPKKTILIKIAETYNVSLEWLMGFDVERSPIRRIPIVVPNNEMFVKLIHYMPEDEYQMVMAAFEKAQARMKEEEGGTE